MRRSKAFIDIMWRICMKGLIIRDLLCLKREIKMFIIISVMIIVTAILFIISSKVGNIANVIDEIKKIENSADAQFMLNIIKVPILFTLFIPAAFIANITDCFKEDGKAGFDKVLLNMPVSLHKRIGGRYLSCTILAVASLMISFIAAFLVSLVSEDFSLGQMIGCALSFNSIILIYMSIVLVLLFFFKPGKEDIIQVVTGTVISFAYLIPKMRELIDMPEQLMAIEMIKIGKEALTFLQDKWFLIFIIAITSLVISYVTSVAIIEKRRRS